MGGLLAGLRPSSDERRRIILGTFLLAALMALPLAANSVADDDAAPVLRGIPIAPVVAALYGQIGRVAAAGSVAEAFSWFGTSVSIGIAGGSVAGGAVIDGHGWRAAVALGIAFLGIGRSSPRRPPRAPSSRRTGEGCAREDDAPPQTASAATREPSGVADAGGHRDALVEDVAEHCKPIRRRTRFSGRQANGRDSPGP